MSTELSPAMSRFAAMILVIFAGAEVAARAAPPSLDVVDPSVVFEGDAAKQHLEILASDAFEGRGVAERGGLLAAAYVAERFAELGLAPGGSGDSFFQSFGVGTGAIFAGSEVVVIAGDTEIPFVATSGDDAATLVALPGSAPGEVSADVVFAGYGVTAPEHGYDDYADLDVKGKIVLVLRHEPREDDPESVFDGRRPSAHATFQRKVENAREHGAAALLLVTDPLNHESLSPTGGVKPRYAAASALSELEFDAAQTRHKAELGLDDELMDLQSRNVRGSGIPALHVDGQLAEALFVAQKRTLLEVQRAIDEQMKPQSFDLGVKARVRLQARSVTGNNVVAILRGASAEMADEYVVLGAHFDHLGVDSTSTIYNGADDNASGTALLLTVAEAFTRSPAPPRRSIVFIAFDGEETGLLGSAHWVANPTVPLAQVAAMVNIDMVGRNSGQPIDVVGATTGAGLVEVVNASVAALELEARAVLDDTFMRSDHFSFYQQGIPVVFFSTGEHPQYHKPDDDIALIDFERVRDVAELTFTVMANLSRLPRMAHVNIDDEVRRSMMRARGPRLGVVPRPVGEEEAALTGVAVGAGLYVEEVVPESPAARAGLIAGDVLVKLGEDSLTGSGRAEIYRALRAALGKIASSGKPAPMTIIRSGKTMEMELSLEVEGG